MKKGDFLDFIVESANPKTGVSFTWAPRVAYLDHNFEDPSIEENYEWEAKVVSPVRPSRRSRGFRRGRKYAQVLLLSNELTFVN